MPTPRTATRGRMVDSAAALLRQHSSAAVTIDAVLARSGAPRGSVYHHFPGGRDQLVAEAVDQSGRYVTELISATDGPPGQVVDRFLEFWHQMLHDTGHQAGCPVVALTVDAGEAEHLLVSRIFSLWQLRLGEVFTRGGIEAQRAEQLATFVIAATEGAVILCRAQRSSLPLRTVGAELHSIIDAAKPHERPRPAGEAEDGP